MSKVIHYTKEYYDKLREYYLKTWPERPVEYFDYQFKEIPEDPMDVQENIIVLNDNDKIIGCQLFLPTRALIHSEDSKIFWGHDTILDEEYRGDLGTELILAVKGNNKFGAGLSEVNYKIQKKLKTPFLGVKHTYIMLNLLSPFSLVAHLKNRGSKIAFKEYGHVKAAGYHFNLITDVKQLSIPNNGYWFNALSDMEFVRDEHFIDKRFINNFNKYYMYAHLDKNDNTDMYFTLRVTYGKGLPVLSIIDFRYNMNDKRAMKAMLKAVNKLALKNSIPFVQLITTMVLDKSLYSFKRKDNPYEVVVGPKKLQYDNPSSIIFTSADSDSDLIII